MRLAAKPDSNQKHIVAILRQCGATVRILAMVGQGVPDLLVSHPLAVPPGQNFLLECKMKDGRLTDAERVFFDEWPGQKAIVYCAEDALRVMGLLL